MKNSDDSRNEAPSLPANSRITNVSKRSKLRNKWFSVRQRIFRLPDDLPLTALPRKITDIIAAEGISGLVSRWRHQKYEQAHRNFIYEQWIVAHEPDPTALIKQRIVARELKEKPLISILMPVWNTPVDVLEEAIQSVVEQTYGRWELCITDGGSTDEKTKALLKKWALKDERIQVSLLGENHGISHNTNHSLEMASGDFIALMDHDDTLAPFALYEAAVALNQDSTLDIIYSDEDKIDAQGHRSSPFFKPDWSPELLLSFMYVGHLTLYRKSILDQLSGFRSKYDFSQDYDLLLRATERTAKIFHIPKVLYHWRMIAGSAASGGKSYARESNLAALEDAMIRRGRDNFDIIGYPTSNRARFKGLHNKSVSIIIPSDSEQQIFECIKSIAAFTQGYHYEILVVTNSSVAEKLSLAFPNQKDVAPVLFSETFNFSKKCNVGAGQAKGEFLLFLNDDIRVLEENWLSAIIEPFEATGVAAVSPKLLYENDLVQHAGLVTGVRNLVGTAFHQQHRDSVEYNNFVQSLRNVSALSAACMMIPKDVFWNIEGFDDVNTPIMHSDIDISFKLREAGFRLVYTPFTCLRHIGHASIGEFEQQAENIKHSNKADLFLLKRWGRYISEDPYYTQNMRDFLYYDSPVPYSMFGDNDPENTRSDIDVMLVSHDLSLSGAPIILKSLASYINGQTNFFMSLFSPCNGELLEDYRALGMLCVVDPLVLQAPNAFRKIIDDHDVIIVNTIVCWQIVLEAKRLGKSVLWLVHEGTFGYELAVQNPGIREALKLADIVAFPSNSADERYRKLLRGDNFRVINYGIADCFGASSMVQDTDPTSEANSRKLKVLSIGSIERRKGQDVILDSFLDIQNEAVGDIELSFIGRILDEAYYSKIRSDSQDSPDIFFLGQLPQAAVLEKISEADVVVCASRDETGPIFILEAMMMSKCVISTPVGLIPDFIREMENGLLFEIDNRTGLSNCLKKLLKDRELASILGGNARKTYAENFKLETYGQRITDCIEDLYRGSV